VDPERAKLEELQSLIVNPDDVGEPLVNPDVPDRVLIHKGALDRVMPTGLIENGVVLLLSDLLIYCVEDAHGLLTVDGVIEITSGASVKAANQKGEHDDLHVLNVLSSEGYGYTFVAEDTTEQQFWFDTIMLAIDPSYVSPVPVDDQPQADEELMEADDQEYAAEDDDDRHSECAAAPLTSTPPTSAPFLCI
jgi:hypothetical protein